VLRLLLLAIAACALTVLTSCGHGQQHASQVDETPLAPAANDTARDIAETSSSPSEKNEAKDDRSGESIVFVESGVMGELYQNQSDRWISFEAPADMGVSFRVPPSWYVLCVTEGAPPDPSVYVILASDRESAERIQIVAEPFFDNAEVGYFQQAKEIVRQTGGAIISEPEDFANGRAKVLRASQPGLQQPGSVRVLLVYVKVGDRLVQVEGAAAAAVADRFEKTVEQLVVGIKAE